MKISRRPTELFWFTEIVEDPEYETAYLYVNGETCCISVVGDGGHGRIRDERQPFYVLGPTDEGYTVVRYLDGAYDVLDTDLFRYDGD